MRSKKETTKITRVGISFSELLTIVFIVLKLIGVIEWSWLWVLSPIWISCAIVLGVLIIAGIIALITYLYNR